MDWLNRVIPSTKDIMLVTLVAILCNGQLCLEKVVTTSEQSGITMVACAILSTRSIVCIVIVGVAISLVLVITKRFSVN